MAGVDDQPLSERSQLELLTNEEVARSVLISNISAKLRRDDIMIHFQRKGNGGGEVNNVFVLKDGKAVIVFDKAEVAERVLKGHHVLGGRELELKPYRSDKERTPQVFSCVIARVNFGMFLLSSRESHSLLEKVKNEAGITWRKDSDAFILTGMFDQVQNAHRYLQEYFGRRPYLQLAQEEEAYSKDTRNTKQNATGFSSKVAKITDICEVDVQPTFKKLLKQVHKTALQDIEKEFCVEIVWGEDGGLVTIRPKENTQESLYREGCDIFTDLCQKVHQDIKREVVQIENVNDGEGIQNAIRIVEEQNPVVIEKLKNQLFVYAEENNMRSSMKALNEQLELIQTRNQTAAQDQRSFGHDACNMTEQHRRDQPSLPNILQQTLINGVNLSLRQGDITEEKVDAIVNPTNSQLYLGGEAGVSAAMVRKGGRQILDDAWYVKCQRNAPLQVGEAVYTLSGNLPCQNVIHAVSPDWRVNRETSVPLLRRACLESLRLAVRLGLRSIALPAISTGNFGMPKDICAQAIFKAVEEYSSSIDAEYSNLRDIRILIIDDPTFDVFCQEFVKRYCSNGNYIPIDQERASASTRNSTREPQKAKGTLGNERKNISNKPPKDKLDNSKGDDAIEQMGTQNIKSSNANHQAGRNGAINNTLKVEYLTETADQEKSSVYSPLNEDQAGGVTHPDGNDDSGSSNGGNVPDPKSNASKASEKETQTLRSYTPTEGSTADIATVKNFSQVPQGKTSKQTDPNNSTTEPSTKEAPLEFSDTSQRNQPVGLMSWKTEKHSLPGHEDCETIAITYNLPQGWEHPRPGHPHQSLYFTAYLPNNAEGQAVCGMLNRAFDARLLFPIGRSPFTGEDNQIVWNGVEHKVNRLGGPSNSGYPDPDYLGRVKAQLASKGIKDDTSPAQSTD